LSNVSRVESAIFTNDRRDEEARATLYGEQPCANRQSRWRTKQRDGHAAPSDIAIANKANDATSCELRRHHRCSTLRANDAQPKTFASHAQHPALQYRIAELLHWRNRLHATAIGEDAAREFNSTEVRGEKDCAATIARKRSVHGLFAL
jgi:hypothetical protein